MHTDFFFSNIVIGIFVDLYVMFFNKNNKQINLLVYPILEAMLQIFSFGGF